VKNSTLTGILMALSAAALWGTTGTAQTFASQQTSAYWIGALRLVIASLFFAAVAARATRAQPAGAFSLRTAWHWILLGGVSIAAYNLCFFAGVKAAGVAAGTGVAIGSGPVWVGLLQAAISRQAPRPLWWLGTALAVVGVSLMLAGAGTGAKLDPLGLGLCLTAGLAYACYCLVSKQLLAIASPEMATFCVFSTAAVIALPVAIWASDSLALTGSGWTMVVYLGVVATGVAYLLFNYALRQVSTATCVTLSLAEPVTAFILAIIVVGERPTLAAYGGLGLVMAGLLLVVWLESRQEFPHNNRISPS
jgi:drug/metabolite transporter, DME family